MTEMTETPAKQFERFLAKYTPEMVRATKQSLTRMRKLVPGATELVYDNYNALVVGFGPGERASEALFSVVPFPRWVTLCFLYGRGLADPHGLLNGSGSRVRHIRLETPATLDRPEVLALIGEALLNAKKPIDPGQPRRMVIKSVSAKQRPRRPS